MSVPAHFNYAKFFGFESVAAAAIFAVLYTPFTAFFIFKIIQERRRVLFSLTLFCIVRVVGFVMRAVSAGIESAGENESLLIASEVFFSIGFFGLLYSSYSLVMDRLDLCDVQPTHVPIIGVILTLTRNRRLFRLALIVPMALGIAGINDSSSNPSSSTGTNLRKVSAIIFLVMTIVQVLQTLVLIKAEREDADRLALTSTSFGATHAAFLFGLISVLLLIREVFVVATIGSFSKQNDEHFWYPLVALPELLCVMLYAIPGLIPPQAKDLPK